MLNNKIKYFTLITIGLIILAIVIVLSKPLQILDIIRNINLVYTCIVILIVLIIYFIQTIRFRLLISTFHHSIPLWTTFRIVVAAAISNIALPGSGGDILIRPLITKKKFNIPYKEAFLCVLVERITDIFILFIFVMISIFILIPKYMMYSYLMFLAGIISVIVLFFIPEKHLPSWVPGFIIKYLKILREVRQIKIRTLIFSIFLTIINVFLMVLTTYFIVKSLNIVPTFELIGLTYISIIIGIFSLIPSGLGVSDGTAASLFVYFGLEPSIGVSITLLHRFIVLFVSMLFLPGIMFKIKSQDESSNKKIF
jgi:glycosyltransferase 2 family protein